MTTLLFGNRHDRDRGIFTMMPLSFRAESRVTEDHETTFRQELAAFLPRLRRAAYSKAKYFVNPGETAEDAVQTTCLRALEKAHQCEGRNFVAWILTILDSRLADEGKRRTERPLADPGDVEKLVDQVDSHAAIAQMVVIHRNQLDLLRLHLSEVQWRTVMLVYMLGYTYEEAAGILDIPLGTVMSRLHTVRRIARERLC